MTLSHGVSQRIAWEGPTNGGWSGQTVQLVLSVGHVTRTMTRAVAASRNQRRSAPVIGLAWRIASRRSDRLVQTDKKRIRGPYRALLLIYIDRNTGISWE